MAAKQRDDSAEANKTRRNRVAFTIQGLALTVLSSYVCAGAYVLATIMSVPPTDGAYRQPLALLDPFVWTVAIPVATAIALIVFPVALFSLWHRDVLRAGLFVLGSTVLTILGTTPYLSLLAIPLSAGVAVGALLFCRFARLALFRQRQTDRRA
jgi:hypothetical protein